MDPFEQSADMRLLELQRKALGVEAPPRPNWTGSQGDMIEAIPVEDEAVPVLTGARITVDLSANPDGGLIPGAVVTLSLAINNQGDRPAEGVRVTVPLPGSASYRAASLLHDQRAVSVSESDAFFGAGLLIPSLAAGQRAGFTWKISVEPGTMALVVSPRVTAEGAGVTGGSPILLSRRAIEPSHTLPDAYRPEIPVADSPFYELDEHEERDFEREIADGEDRPVLYDDPLVVMPDIAIEVPAAVPEPVAEPVGKPEAADAAPEASAVQTQTEPRLYSTFDRAALGIVKKLFASESLGQIPHYILQNSLACSVAPDGADFGIRASLSQQAGMLSRALLMRKLNKAMHVGDFADGRTDFDISGALNHSGPAADHPLYMVPVQADIDFCMPVEERNPLESFVRIRQLAVALQAHRVQVENDALKERIEQLLQRYATSARAAINRTFIRAKLDSKFDPFGAGDPASDKLAHDLIEALSELFAP